MTFTLNLIRLLLLATFMAALNVECQAQDRYPFLFPSERPVYPEKGYSFMLWSAKKETIMNLHTNYLQSESETHLHYWAPMGMVPADLLYYFNQLGLYSVEYRFNQDGRSFSQALQHFDFLAARLTDKYAHEPLEPDALVKTLSGEKRKHFHLAVAEEPISLKKIWLADDRVIILEVKNNGTPIPELSIRYYSNHFLFTR